MILFIVLYSIVTIVVAGHIILHGSRANKSLSWILILILFPFLGAILYLIFGLNRRRFKFYTLKQTTRRRLYDLGIEDDLNAEKKVNFESRKAEKLTLLMESSTKFPAYVGNNVTVLQNGKEMFPAIFETIRSAQQFIHLQYYIFEEGELMNKFYQLLKEKIAEDVEVRILYDAIGSFGLSKKMVRKFTDIGAEVYKTMPLKYGSFLFTLNYRNHRKIAIIDGKIGFTGGMNVSDKYIKSKGDLGIWDDTHLRLEGPAVDSLHRIFIKDYYFASKTETLVDKKYLPTLESAGNTTVQIVASGPDSRQPSIMQQYITMINLAEKFIYISNPYFIPNTAMLEALRIAALSGVVIKILIPLKSDSRLAKYSMLSHFEELLSLGVEIYAQRENFLHSKIIVLDGEIASVGSGNFDHRSFEHNFETNALIYDEKIAQAICDDFLEDCAQSTQLDYETFKNRPLRKKIFEGIARFFSPLL